MRPFFYISIVFISSLTIAIDDDTELPAAELTLVFPAGSTNGTRCSSIPITDDELLEGNHEFTVTLTGAGSHASIDTLSSVTTVTIIDDESESESSAELNSKLYLPLQIWQLLIWTQAVHSILKEVAL